MKAKLFLGIMATIISAMALPAKAESENPYNMMKTENLSLVQEWDKTFPQSEKVNHSKVTFRNRYGKTLAADLYMPKNVTGKLPAIAVSGPFGAVKEQVSGLYAQKLAENGFLTIAFDPSYTGESGGEPRYIASPDINTEDFSAAVDYLLCRDDVNPEKVGILGICGRRHCNSGCNQRPAHQSHGSLDNVRYDTRKRQRLFRQRELRRTAQRQTCRLVRPTYRRLPQWLL